MMAIGGAAFVAAALIFFWWPGLDLEAAYLFYAGNGQFTGDAAAVETVRRVFKAVFTGGCILAALGLVATWGGRRTLLGMATPKWVFLVALLATGPGLVANVLLKDQMGRARPRQIEAFGGEKALTPPLVPAQECVRNCSFVSGEASSIFALFFGLALMVPRRTAALAGAGLALGGLVGLIRMAQGGHFLSDVIFAGIFMAVTAGALYALILTRWPMARPPATPGGASSS